MSSRVRPITMIWNGQNMVPLPRHQRQCDEQFEVGRAYPLLVHEERSAASQSHYFAQLRDLWLSLPEKIAAKYPSVEALRAKALVECGYCDEKNFVCDTDGHARSLAMNLRSRSPFAVILLSGNVVFVYDAKSQSNAAMGKEEFEASKVAVLEYCLSLVGVTWAELHRMHPPKRKSS